MVLPYLWIAIVGGIVAFLYGCCIGANDLANAFGTSYGSKVLSLRYIVLIAAVFEFGGAVGLGKQVTSTMASGIASADTFAGEPYVMMYGMLCTLFAAFTWVFAATYLSLPVSTTHSVAGGILGFALVYGGGSAVIWAGKKSDFPYVKGLTPIILSWFISPVLTGTVSVAIYLPLRYLVLQSENCVRRAVLTLPIAVLFTCFFESVFVLYKGASDRLKWSIGKTLWVSAIVGIISALISVAFIPLVRKKVKLMTEEAERRALEENRDVEDVQDEMIHGKRAPGHTTKTAADGHKDGSDNGEEAKEAFASEPVHGTVANGQGRADSSAPTNGSEDETPKQFSRVKLFDKRAEYVFRYLQVFTAICTSFAHGASDVSNAIGPYTAIYHIYLTGKTSSKAEAPLWLLCLGGAGIVVGLATYGLKILRLLGEKITLITPSRGFSAELATALVVSFASAYGIPVSTTHCITGAVVAISIADVGICHIQWRMVLKMYAGWILTVFITASLSGFLFAQGVYAPSKIL